MLRIFLEGGAAPAAGPSMLITIGWLGIFFVIFYFIAIRPQKKQEKEHLALVESAAIGDSVLTSSGFYGVLIDVMDEVVIVEFGNNKNCRIPMKKSAIAQLEKQGEAEEIATDNQKDSKK
jgi:preprotein translocase subunit YajC